MKVILGALWGLMLAATASADEIYSYTGPAPADLSGSFTTASLLTPQYTGYINADFRDVLTWSFTDGVDVWNPSNSLFGGGAAVNADGTFAAWSFRLLEGQTKTL